MESSEIEMRLAAIEAAVTSGRDNTTLRACCMSTNRSFVRRLERPEQDQASQPRFIVCVVALRMAGG